MQYRSSILFKVLLNRFHAGVGESFLKYLPKEEGKEILDQNVSSPDALPILNGAPDQIERTHYSWLTPVIQQIPKPLQPLVIASLTKSQSAHLSKMLNVSIEGIKLSDETKKFFQKVLWEWWKPQHVLPFSYLPTNPLLPLAEMDKNELVEFIDFLAIYDLTETIRHMVHKKYLISLYQALTPKKQQFLRICLHQEEKIVSPKLELEKWNGDPQKLEAILHRRGLFRLGRALSGQHPDFLWHLTHKLDSGRGAILAKYCSSEAIPNITPRLVQQVVFLINFLKKKSET